jgi:hypothetical protein
MRASIYKFGQKAQPILCGPWILAKIDSKAIIIYQVIKTSNQNLPLLINNLKFLVEYRHYYKKIEPQDFS